MPVPIGGRLLTSRREAIRVLQRALGPLKQGSFKTLQKVGRFTPAGSAKKFLNR
jgi:hypothetical protein